MKGKIMRENKESGITLIALVIMIIVILVLAGVTIQMLTGDNSTIKMVGKAKEETEKSGELEKVRLAVTETGLNNLNEEKLKESLENNGFKILTSGSGTNFKVVNKGWIFKGVYEKYYIKSNGNVIVVANRDKLKVGDYVNYTYDTNENDYLVKGIYSGYYTTDSEGIKSVTDKSISQTKNLNWQVFNINEDTGGVTLISSTSTNSDVYFGGAVGYNNCVYIMNDICRVFYSNKSLNIEARSINLDDLANVMNPTGKEQVLNSTKNSSQSAGVSNVYYPDIWKYEKGSTVNNNSYINTLESDESYSGYLEGVTEKKYGFADKVKFTRMLVYKTSPAEWFSNNYYNDGYSNPVYNLIFNTRYFLATRTKTFKANGCVDFGIQFVNTVPIISYNSIYESNNTEFLMSNILRPIVTIASNIIIDFNSGDGTTPETAYSMYLNNK